MLVGYEVTYISANIFKKYEGYSPVEYPEKIFAEISTRQEADIKK